MERISLVLYNIRSTHNVGAILRTAEGFGVERTVFSGYTPRYDDPQLLPHLRTKLNRQIEKTALGAEKIIQQIAVEPLSPWLAEQKARGALVLGLENHLRPQEIARQLVLGSRNEKALAERISTAPEVLLLLGEEVSGIPPVIRPLLDYFLEIPMAGQKESFNVSVATGIALWELARSAH